MTRWSSRKPGLIDRLRIPRFLGLYDYSFVTWLIFSTFYFTGPIGSRPPSSRRSERGKGERRRNRNVEMRENASREQERDSRFIGGEGLSYLARVSRDDPDANVGDKIRRRRVR